MIFIDVGKQAVQLGERGERIVSQASECARGDSAAPEWLAQPVADFSADAVNVAPRHQADTTDDMPLHANREIERRRLPARKPNPSFRVLPRVRLRKPLAQMPRDVRIIRLPDKVRLVTRPKWTKFAV